MTNLPRIAYYLANAMRRLHWNKKQMRKYQEKKLRFVVENAYRNVPFYNRKFKEAKIKPYDIRSLDDLSKLPITTKKELRQAVPKELLSRESNISSLSPIRTSGSTGHPFTFYINSKEMDWRKAIYMRANISCGQKARDKWVVVTAPHHFSDTTNIQRRLGFYAQTCISVFESVDAQANLIGKIKPDVLDGYSGSLMLLAKEISEKGQATVRPRLVFGSADLIDESSVALMEKVFSVPYLDQFGCAEIDRSAWQCPEKIGYHMDVDSVITQFVDEEGKDVSAGERGEVVYTSLFNSSMPFIRYAVGDVGIPSDDECSCDRKLPLMKVIEGRKDSLITLRNNLVISPRVLRLLVADFLQEFKQFRIVQKDLDLLEIYIEKNCNSTDHSKLSNEIVECLQRSLSLHDLKVVVEFVDKIPLGKNGKLMSVISELQVS